MDDDIIIHSQDGQVIQSDLSNAEQLQLYILENYKDIILRMDIGAKSIKDYTKRAGRFISFLEGTDLTEDILIRYKKHLKKEYARNTASTLDAYLSASKVIFRQLYLEGKIRVNLAERVKGFKFEKWTGKPFRSEDIKKLLAVIEQLNPNIRIRQKAMFYVLVFQGLRSAELVSMQIDHIDLKFGTFKIKPKGKDGFEDRIFKSIVLDVVREYLEADGRRTGYLFASIARNNLGNQIGTSTVRNYLRRLCQLAGVDNHGLHGFRRSLASRLNKAGVDLVSIRDVLGHASIATTAGYIRKMNKMESMRAALEKDTL